MNPPNEEGQRNKASNEDDAKDYGQPIRLPRGIETGNIGDFFLILVVVTLAGTTFLYQHNAGEDSRKQIRRRRKELHHPERSGFTLNMAKEIPKQTEDKCEETDCVEQDSRLF